MGVLTSGAAAAAAALTTPALWWWRFERFEKINFAQREGKMKRRRRRRTNGKREGKAHLDARGDRDSLACTCNNRVMLEISFCFSHMCQLLYIHTNLSSGSLAVDCNQEHQCKTDQKCVRKIPLLRLRCGFQGR